MDVKMNGCFLSGDVSKISRCSLMSFIDNK